MVRNEWKRIHKLQHSRQISRQRMSIAIVPEKTRHLVRVFGAQIPKALPRGHRANVDATHVAQWPNPRIFCLPRRAPCGTIPRIWHRTQFQTLARGSGVLERGQSRPRQQRSKQQAIHASTSPRLTPHHLHNCPASATSAVGTGRIRSFGQSRIRPALEKLGAVGFEIGKPVRG